MVTANGPSFDQLISPAPELVNESNPPAYTSLTYRQFYEVHQSNSLDEKSALDRIPPSNIDHFAEPSIIHGHT